jgi:hypothetical protein
MRAAAGARRLAAATTLAIAALVLAAGCAERKTPVEIRAHPAEWSAAASPDFHGKRVERSGPSNCVPCHEADFRGGFGVPGCYDCHAGPGGHPGGWASPASSAFHGDAVAESGPGPCATCHGDDHRGGWSGVSCYECHTGGPSGHPDGWLDPLSASYHGLEVLTEGVDRCTTCHGFTLGGGTSGVACADCHG